MQLDHLEDLRVFVQIVDSGSLAAAGRILNISATLVSRRIARLETSLNVRLLERSTRRLKVTDEGRAFYLRCRRILTELEAAEEELKPASHDVSGVVRAVLPTSLLAYGVMNALKILLAQHPELTVQLQVSDSDVDLLGGGWDVATHIGLPKDSGHIGKYLGDIAPKLAATESYLEASGEPLTPMDLIQHQCIRIKRQKTQTHWPITDAEGQSHQVPITGQLICHDVISLYSAMKAGLGIGLIPAASLKSAKQKGELVEVLETCRVESNSLYALIPAGRHKVVRIKVFVDWLAQFVQSLNAD